MLQISKTKKRLALNIWEICRTDIDTTAKAK